MNPRAEIREMRRDEAGSVAALVQASFARFVAPDFEAAGIDNFCRFATANQIELRQRRGCRTLVAEHVGKLCGMAQFRAPAHVLMLFVDAAHHRRGIARRLLEEGIAHLREKDPVLREITVNSSPHAVRAYRRMGFVVAGPASDDGGIISVPMRRVLMC